jgi:CRISPR-associated protein Cas5t
MLRLRVQAPFAVFRNFTAGSFRPSAPFLTYSAAYGLLLNLAGREMRAPDDGQSVTTWIAADLPRFELALGVYGALPTVQYVFQQLHNYPVGSTGKERKNITFGSKYNIVPTRRVVLHRLDALIAVRGDPDLEANILAGLRGERVRYGLPFLGDNNFLPDRIAPVTINESARWLVALDNGSAMDDVPEHGMRLTIAIDRIDMAKTQSQLFRVEASRKCTPPDGAWVEVGY